MRRIAIIPVLGEVSELLKKNHPNNTLIANIKNAFNSRLFDEVIVVAKHQTVIKLANMHGANVFLWAMDESRSTFGNLVKVLVEILEKFKQKGIQINYGCCILPSALAASASILKEAFNKIISEKLDSVVSVASYRYPIEKALQVQNDKLVVLRPEFTEVDTSSLEASYYDLEQFYLFKVDGFLKSRTLITKKTGALVISDEQIAGFQEKSIERNLRIWTVNNVPLNHLEGISQELLIKSKL